MTRCRCWNVARDGHAVDCEAVREELRRFAELDRKRMFNIPPHLRATGEWTEAELRVADGNL